MDHIGIDVHKRESQICLLAEGGELMERRIRTEPERFAAVLGGRPRARIVIEASTDSEWVARCLEALGHEVVVADPNFAPMYATRTRKVKTDRRDAHALADACVLGAYRRAHRLSDPQRHVRGRLLVRDALVRTRTRYISLIRALLRQQGYRVPSGSAEAFATRVRALALPGPLLSLIAPLLAVMRPLNRQLAYSDTTIEHVAARCWGRCGGAALAHRARPLCAAPRRHRLRATPLPPTGGRGHAPRLSEAQAPGVSLISHGFHGVGERECCLGAVPRPPRRRRPHSRLPSCAGEPQPRPSVSANRRMTKPRETGEPPPRKQSMDTKKRNTHQSTREDLTRPAAS
jgi:hypothetical protein